MTIFLVYEIFDNSIWDDYNEKVIIFSNFAIKLVYLKKTSYICPILPRSSIDGGKTYILKVGVCHAGFCSL